MNIRMLEERFVHDRIVLEKGKEYLVLQRAPSNQGYVVQYNLPRSTRRVMVGDDECEVVKESLVTKIKNKLRAENQ